MDKLKPGYISPFTVRALKELLDQMPDDADISYSFGGALVWNDRDNTLYVNEM